MEQLIESIYHETGYNMKKMLIAMLSAELQRRPTPSEFVRRRTIERLIELIYHEPNIDFRRALTALLAGEEAAGLAECDQS